MMMSKCSIPHYIDCCFILGNSLNMMRKDRYGTEVLSTDRYVRGELMYFVESTLTGERRGQFDCETWASEMARELNRQEAEPKTKVLIFDTAKDARNTVLNFKKRNKDKIMLCDEYKLPYMVTMNYGVTIYFMTPHYFKRWKVGKDENEYRRCTSETLYV